MPPSLELILVSESGRCGRLTPAGDAELREDVAQVEVDGPRADGHCERAVTQEVGAVEGVRDVRVDLAAGTVTVAVDGPVDRADIAAAVDEAGYVLVP
jgi:copper chaperone CopZ